MISEYRLLLMGGLFMERDGYPYMWMHYVVIQHNYDSVVMSSSRVCRDLPVRNFVRTFVSQWRHSSSYFISFLFDFHRMSHTCSLAFLLYKFAFHRQRSRSQLLLFYVRNDIVRVILFLIRVWWNLTYMYMFTNIASRMSLRLAKVTVAIKSIIEYVIALSNHLFFQLLWNWTHMFTIILSVSSRFNYLGKSTRSQR